MKDKKLLAALDATAMFFTLLLAVAVGLILFGWFASPHIVPPLSPVLAYFHGLPSDTHFYHSFKDGTVWRFCRDVPSGRAIFEEWRTKLEYGRRCEAVPSGDRNPEPDLQRPSLRVHRNGWITFELPPAPDYYPLGSCPQHSLSRTYLGRSFALLKEASELSDLPDGERSILLTAGRSVGSFSAERLTGVCNSELRPPNPERSAD